MGLSNPDSIRRILELKAPRLISNSSCQGSSFKWHCRLPQMPFHKVKNSAPKINAEMASKINTHTCAPRKVHFHVHPYVWELVCVDHEVAENLHWHLSYTTFKDVLCPRQTTAINFCDLVPSLSLSIGMYVALHTHTHTQTYTKTYIYRKAECHKRHRAKRRALTLPSGSRRLLQYFFGTCSTNNLPCASSE